MPDPIAETLSRTLVREGGGGREGDRERGRQRGSEDGRQGGKRERRKNFPAVAQLSTLSG